MLRRTKRADGPSVRSMRRQRFLAPGRDNHARWQARRLSRIAIPTEIRHIEKDLRNRPRIPAD